MDKNFRDMCAIMAMQGMIAGRPDGYRNTAMLAEQAFMAADAMVAEREKRDRDAKRDGSGRVVG